MVTEAESLAGRERIIESVPRRIGRADAPPPAPLSPERGMVRVVRVVRRLALITLGVEACVLAASVLFLGAPQWAPVTLLTVLLLVGLLSTIVLAVIAVAAGIQRLALPHTPVDDEVEAHLGWRAPVAIGIFLIAVIVSLLLVPEGLPTIRNGQYGYLESQAGGSFVRLSEGAYAELVLQQLRFVATFATVFAAWVAMSLTRHHPGWDEPHR